MDSLDACIQHAKSIEHTILMNSHNLGDQKLTFIIEKIEIIFS